jgi:hypothetical protein
MEPGRVCEDVGFAIAGRTFECTDDTDLAMARSNAFDDGYSCRVESVAEPIDLYYACPVAVNALSCGDVEGLADDLDRWLAASPTCAVILEHSDGTPLPSLEEP